MLINLPPVHDLGLEKPDWANGTPKIVTKAIPITNFYICPENQRHRPASEWCCSNQCRRRRPSSRWGQSSDLGHEYSGYWVLGSSVACQVRAPRLDSGSAGYQIQTPSAKKTHHNLKESHSYIISRWFWIQYKTLGNHSRWFGNASLLTWNESIRLQGFAEKLLGGRTMTN